MVWDFGIVENIDEAGWYVGYIASMFTLGQLVTGVFWGRMSDRIGRRNVICFGFFATMIVAPFFGLAQNLWQAMAVRFTMGLLNGNAAAAKAYIGEAVTKETQDLGFSIVAICWSLGNIIAACLGGYLCRPAEQYPSIFEGTILERWPYLLPCLVSSLFAGVGFVITFIFLPEQPKPAKLVTEGPEQQPQSVWSYIIQNRRCTHVCAMYFWVSGLDCGMFEIYPLWAITSVGEGGLGWTPAQVGTTQLVGGGFLLASNLLLLPALRKRFTSSLKLQRLGIIAMAIPGFSLFPVVSSCCAGDYTATMLSLLPIWFLRISSVGIIYTMTFQFVNGMVDDRAILGAVTGAAQQAGNVARFIAPMASAMLVAFANQSSSPFPLDERLPFVVFGVCWVVPLSINLCLSEADVTMFQQPGMEEQPLAVPAAGAGGGKRRQGGGSWL
jgi:MFS family permease